MEVELIELLCTNRDNLAPIASFEMALQTNWLHADATMYLPIVEQFAWTQYVYLHFTTDRDEQPIDLDACQFLLKSYFEVASPIVISLPDTSILILLNCKAMTDGNPSTYEQRQAWLEMAEGAVAALVEEFSVAGKMTIHPPLTPLQHWTTARDQFLMTVTKHRLVYPERQVMGTWEFALARLLDEVSDASIEYFLQNYQLSEPLRDLELRKTLRLFLHANCNVTEAARKLYIHRNTLLYRLERFRKQTGLDVKQFADAGIVQIALLLYGRQN